MSKLGAKGASVRLIGLSKLYGTNYGVKDVSLDVAPGELLTLLGPSGSGKTTTLMMIAGFTEPSSGTIFVGDRNVTDEPPHWRGLGVVFQGLALFPHMTVAENVAFPMRMRRLGEAETRDKTMAALDVVRLGGLSERYPHQLSGGQQQRVALARAIVFDPPVLLLDEPLGALDKKLREDLQREIRMLHARLGTTIINVTHDQTEALAISDRIAVMDEGRIEQLGPPRTVYENPVNWFVANFIGNSNLFSGTVLSAAGNRYVLKAASGLQCIATSFHPLIPGNRVEFLIRPEQVTLGPAAQDLCNRFLGRVTDASYVGELTRLCVSLASGEEIKLTIHGSSIAQLSKTQADDVVVGWQSEDVLVLESR